ncbi:MULTISPECIES: NUDIX domain-containing protein [unclassified Streptomyces]|uniref:NUDIX domain-containing protein n=1 Tax=unclassified Streptomyces TaxID=2593676 RepID=UPI0004C28A6B|nr:MULTISPECIES: NUDIX domain-containing protein [unclassified Streptomyces]
MDQQISVSVKAALVRSGRILVVEYLYPGDDLHYNLPGGRVKNGEGLRDAVVRKVREETLAEVDPGRLLLLTEYIPERWNGEFGDYQKVQATFACTLRPGSPEPAMPPEPDDPHQTAVTWLPLEKLRSVVLLPKITEPLLTALGSGSDFDPLIDRW